MQPLAYPLAFGQWQITRDSLQCRLPRRTVAVQAPQALLAQVAQLCNGRRAWAEVAAALATNWSARSVQAFLGRLAAEGAVVEAGEALAGWSELGQWPALFPQLAAPAEARALQHVAHERLLPGTGPWALPPPARSLARLLAQRRSHRTFADAPLGAEVLSALLWAAHGVAAPATAGSTRWHRTVASGGNLHPVRWFALVLRALPHAGGCVSPGFYEAQFHLQGGASLRQLEAGAEAAWRILRDPRALRFASALLLPVAELALPARKYGNRALLFAQAEAGAALQNAQLMALACGAGSVVRGDLQADAITALLRPQFATTADGRRPVLLALPALLAGAPASAQEEEQERRARAFRMGPAHTRAAGATGPAPMPRYAFFAGPVRVGGADLYASGRSHEPRVAAAKAEAEAWERLGWATPAGLVTGRLAEVPGALDPAAVVAYAEPQRRAPDFPFLPFSRRRRYLWKTGHDAATGAPVALPAECVHALTALPRRERAPACTSSSTSGLAAWTDAEGALCRATLELVERDAFLRCWLARRAPPQWATEALPGPARARMQALAADGLRVVACRLPSALAHVAAVFVQCRRRPFTVVTAAAEFAPEAALERALDEAEGRIVHAAAATSAPLASPRAVRCLEDIPRLYRSRRCYRLADFLADGPPIPSAAATGVPADWPALRQRLATLGLPLLAFDLTPPGAALDQGRRPLHVVRAVVPGLLPIWFRHGLEPAGLAAWQAACAQGPGMPPFIHPFT